MEGPLTAGGASRVWPARILRRSAPDGSLTNPRNGLKQDAKPVPSARAHGGADVRLIRTVNQELQ